MKPRSSSCELCGGIASVYCSSDSAFLCAGCDARVHGANFLAARHVRTPIASPIPSSSTSVSDEDADDSASSSVRSAASSCISTAGDHSDTSNNKRLPRPRRPSSVKKTTAAARGGTTRAEIGLDARAEGVLASWCATLGAGSTANCASHATSVGLRRLGANVPPRVCAAAAVWFAFKLCCGGQQQGRGQHLRRLEECSGVPARIIAAAESKLSRVVRRPDAEGWAECDSPGSALQR